MNWVPGILGEGPYIAAVWDNFPDDFDHFHRFKSEAERKAWMSGYGHGSNSCGGTGYALPVPGDTSDLNEEQKAELRGYILELRTVLKEALPALCTCSFNDSEEMTRHAPLCEYTKAGLNW